MKRRKKKEKKSPISLLTHPRTTAHICTLDIIIYFFYFLILIPSHTHSIFKSF